MSIRRLLAAGAAIAATALLSGCFIATDPSPDPDPTTTVATSSAAPSPEPTTPVEPTATDPTTPAEEDLPGTPVEGFPEAGTELTIVGVPAAEILNLRIGPGVDFESIARMPGDTDLIATGRGRDLGGSAGVWYQVRAGDDVGWVINTYVAQTGATRDVTTRFATLTAASAQELIDAIGAAWGEGQWEAVSGPTVADDLQVRIDVLSDADPSVRGARLFVVASTNGSDSTDSTMFTVTRVTATQLCARGTTGTGECL